MRAIFRKYMGPTINTNTRRKIALITGGAGFVGTNLTKRLLGQEYIVYSVDNFVTGRRGNIELFSGNDLFHFFEYDITDKVFLEEFLNVKLDYIFNLACPTGVPNIKILGEEMLDVCSNGTKNTLRIANKHNAKYLLSSSCETYGQPEVSPQIETYTGNVDPVGPRSAYEEGKRFSESLVVLYADKYGVDAKIVRIFNTYGPNMSPNDTRVIPQFAKSILNGDKLSIYGDGSQTRTHLFIDDLLNGFDIVINTGIKGQVYNIGGSIQITVQELAEIVLDVAGADNNIIYKPHFIKDHNHRLPCTNKIAALGWKQTVTLKEGIMKMIKSREKQNLPVFEEALLES